MFPADEDHEKPIRRDVGARWLLKAEKLAKLPKISGGVFHPYRRLWGIGASALGRQGRGGGGWLERHGSHEAVLPASNQGRCPPSRARGLTGHIPDTVAPDGQKPRSHN